MPNVVRFALSTARTLHVRGAGQFVAGILDVDANDLTLVSRTRYLVRPYGAVEIGIVDSATPYPSLPAVPVPPPVDPYPMYLDPSEVFDSETGQLRTDKLPDRLSEVELRAALGRPAALAAGTLGRRYLDIPTPDGNPSVTHPDVVFIPEGWNGYRYWMVHTPFPDALRENPCIVASHNGLDWVEPDGITNPVAPLADAVADGYMFQSDGCLVLLADDTMRLYYRASSDPNGETTYYFRDSTDGVTWSSRTALAGGNFGKSPSVHRLADGTFVMYAVNDTPQLVRYTSADGLAWSAATLCTTPALGNNLVPWHCDLVQVDGRWHLLLASTFNPVPSSPYRLHFLTSTDGITFTGSVRPLPRIEPSVGGVDEGGHYRSALVPVQGEDGRLAFDIWVAGVGSGDGISNPWRITLWSGYQPDRVAMREVDKRDQLRSWDATELLPIGSGATKVVSASQWPAVELPDTGITGVAKSFWAPRSWHTSSADIRMRIVLYWTQDAVDAPAGDVAFKIRWRSARDGQDIDVVGQDSGYTAYAAPARRFVKRSTIITTVYGGWGKAVSLYVARSGTNAADTFTSPIRVLGMAVEPVPADGIDADYPDFLA